MTCEGMNAILIGELAIVIFGAMQRHEHGV